MRNIRLTIAYDGTDFVGWQIQKNGRSVQGCLQDALASIHGHPVDLNGAGRTDSGVHADGQVANFHTDIDSIPAGRFTNALNGILPRDVRVVRSEEVCDEFHARYDAVRRTYRYYLIHASVISPSLARYTCRVTIAPDIARLNRMASVLVGEHDFTTFSGPIESNWIYDSPPSRVRTIHSAAFYPEGARIVFEISANGFLWRMVRSIVGTLLEMSGRGDDRDAFEAILDARDRSLAGTTAPAWGLFLHRVEYGQDGVH